MRLAVLAETKPDEHRVALVPESVHRLCGAGFEVSVQPGAGVRAHAPDDDYRAAGAQIDPAAHTKAAVVLAVQPPGPFVAGELRPGTATVSLLASEKHLPVVRTLQARNISSFALDMIPRSSRAQPMDALSSQAMVAGYRAAIVAAERLRQFFPLLMTAAGTVRPANVIVLGAGVAGLQAIATAHRLGANVGAYDVRPASAEEIRSLGARYIDIGLGPLEGRGGYAREMPPERAQRQRELLAPHIAEADALITTASVPGKPAPLLVDRDMVAAMKPGSVVVDLAAESGGNVQGSQPGKEIEQDGVLIWGGRNVPSQLPGPASRLYAANVSNLLALITGDGPGAKLTIDLDDDILAGCCVTHEGALRVAVTGDLLGEVD